MKFSMTANVK